MSNNPSTSQVSIVISFEDVCREVQNDSDWQEKRPATCIRKHFSQPESTGSGSDWWLTSSPSHFDGKRLRPDTMRALWREVGIADRNHPNGYSERNQAFTIECIRKALEKGIAALSHIKPPPPKAESTISTLDCSSLCKQVMCHPEWQGGKHREFVENHFSAHVQSFYRHHHVTYHPQYYIPHDGKTPTSKFNQELEDTFETKFGKLSSSSESRQLTVRERRIGSILETLEEGIGKIKSRVPSAASSSYKVPSAA